VGREPKVSVYPDDPWEPDDRLIDAFLRVTWERPLPEGANDWVEDPHIYLVDSIFEAAAFARDSYLEALGSSKRTIKACERKRAAAVLKVLRWEGRIEEIVASIPPERAKKRRRRRRKGKKVDEELLSLIGQPVLPSDMTRAQLQQGYLEQLDQLSAGEVPLSNALRLAVLFAPALLTHLDAAMAEDPQASIEDKADELIYPIARRHSLARKDRDRIKRCTIVLRRMLSGEARERSRGRDRQLSRDYFREAIVLLWIHLKAVDADLEPFHFWQDQAKKVKPESDRRKKKKRGRGRRRRRGRGRGR